MKNAEIARMFQTMADIDNLKQVNDSYGHRTGDAVIKQISRRLLACIRQIDSAARYGGDEFSIVLPNTSLADAVVVAERMVKMVTESPLKWENHKIPLSIKASKLYNKSEFLFDGYLKAKYKSVVSLKFSFNSKN